MREELKTELERFKARYLSVEWDPNCRSVAKVQRIIDFENEE